MGIVTNEETRERRERRRRGWRRVCIGVFWLVMMGWLIRCEAFPELFTSVSPGYRSLLSRDLLVMDSWMRISFKGAPIGFSHTSMEVNENNPIEYHQVQNRVNVRFKAMGSQQNLRVDTLASLNALYDLQGFMFSMNTDAYTMDLKADRVGPRRFRVSIKSGKSRQLTTIDIPPDVVLYSPMTDMALKNLKPGQTLSLRTLDPATLGSAVVTMRSLRRDVLELKGRKHPVNVIAAEYQGATMLSFIADTGETLRQETSIGWVMEKCTVDEAFEALRISDRAEDMLTGLAVPVKGRLSAFHGSREIRLKMKGVPFAPGELASNRQRMESVDGLETILALRPAQVPGEEARRQAAWLTTGGEIPAVFQDSLASTLAVQADHPDMKARAREITGGTRDPLDKAQRIFEWVHRGVEKEMTISMPSALDVLKTMKGDCNEHTYLFVALARAAGVPAKIKVGLAYHKGAFYYHAWPAVYVGDWMEMDPTWGQTTVDATHIALVDGELSSQVQMVKVIGQLKIEALEDAARPTARGEAEDKGEEEADGKVEDKGQGK